MCSLATRTGQEMTLRIMLPLYLVLIHVCQYIHTYRMTSLTLFFVYTVAFEVINLHLK